MRESLVEEKTLELDQTKLFSYEKEATPEAMGKRVLLTFDNPGAYGAITPVLEKLLHDDRCRGVVILASGWALKQFEKDDRFTQLKDIPPKHDQTNPAHETVLADLLEITQKNSPDVVLASLSAKDGPETVALFGGKGNLAAKKVFFIVDGWGIGSSEGRVNPVKKLDAQVDGIFCNDELAATLAKRAIPHVPAEKFIVAGSPAIEALHVDDSEAFTKEARGKIGVPEDAIAILYAGDVEDDYKDFPGTNAKHINSWTLNETLRALSLAAEHKPEKKFAFLLRPHPRDPEADALLEFAREFRLPPNVSIIDVSHPHITSKEALHAADAITSIVSTMNFQAPDGRPAFFLAYDEPGMGGEAARQVYGDQIPTIEKDSNGMKSFVHSREKLAGALEGLERAKNTTRPITGKLSVDQIVDRIFE